MKNNIIKTRKFKLGVYSFSSILVLVGILLLVNYLSFNIFRRMDLSSGGIYSLSKASKTILRGLDDPVIIKCFFTKNLSPPYNTQGKYLRDLLIEYRTHSRGKVKFEFLDPSEDEEIKKEAMTSGIRPLTFTQVENDKYEMKEGYMGIIFLYADRKEIIPFVKDVTTLEYDITSHIRKITETESKSVGFLQGHMEQDLNEEGFSQVKTLLERNYEVKPIFLQGGENSKALEEVDALVISGPMQKMKEKELFAIDQYIMKGNPVAFLLDTVEVDMTNFSEKQFESNLPELLEGYGIKVKKGLVVDRMNNRIGVNTRSGFYSMRQIVNYPLMPLVTEFSKENPIVKDLQRITLPFVSPIEIMDSEADIEAIVSSSKRSWHVEQMASFNPLNKYPQPADSTEGPFPLAVVRKGSLKSYFGGKEPEDKTIDTGNMLKESLPNRILVTGSSKFIRTNFADQANISFFMNIVDWVAQDSALISIRGKSMIYRPLKDLKDHTRVIIKWLNVFLMPVLFVIFGIIRWRIRLSIKKRILV